MKYIFVLLFVCMVFFNETITQAQEDTRSANINIYPEYPKPFDKVTLTLESYSFDVDRAKITWSTNGKILLSGYGEKSFNVTLGGEGVVTKVLLNAELAEGGSYSSFVTLSPSSVDLLWDAPESYTPPMYAGKALPSEGGLVSVVAIPSFFKNGRRYDPSSIIYRWSFNDESLGSLSGVGKQTLTIRLNYLEPENTVSVIATTLDGEQSARGSVVIVPKSIEPRLYINDPLFGIRYENSLAETVSIRNETSFAFVPYFISTKNLFSTDLEYSWTLGGYPVSPQMPGILTVRPKNGVSGSEILSVGVDQTKKYLQNAAISIRIFFDSK